MSSFDIFRSRECLHFSFAGFTKGPGVGITHNRSSRDNNEHEHQWCRRDVRRFDQHFKLNLSYCFEGTTFVQTIVFLFLSNDSRWNVLRFGIICQINKLAGR